MTNKEKARAYFTAVNQYDAATVESMVDENYIQHNPRVPTGRAAFVSLLPKLKQHRSRIENVRMLQDGPYIAMHHVWRNATPFGKDEMMAFHIIRFDNSGLIAEHWSVMAELISVAGETIITDLGETERNRSKIVQLFDLWMNGKNTDLHPLASDGNLAIEYTRQHKVLGEGNFILSISEGIHQRNPAACYDLFRIRGCEIAEHWHIYQEIPKTGIANENTMFNFF